MDLEKLNKANSLNSEILEIKKQIDSLEKSHGISDSLISLSTGYLYKKYFDFKLFKTITLARLKERLNELENEFNNL